MSKKLSNLKNKNLITILLIYLIFSVIISKNYLIYKNLINPIFWSFIIIYSLYLSKYTPLKKSSKYYSLIILIIIINTTILYSLGFFFGFSKSPYNHDLISLIFNIFTKIIPLIGLELSRSITINQNKSKNPLILLTILFILLEINYHSITNIITNKEYFFKYICSTIIPLIASNILYTYLIYKNTYHLVLISRLLEKAITILIPVFPSLNWFINGTINLIKPIITYIIFKYLFIKEKHQEKNRHYSFILISYSFTLLIVILLISFMIGLLKYEPIAILSNSMNPTYNRGDIIIFEKPSPKDLNNLPIGTIIIYKLDNQYIAHRIVKIKKIANKVSYLTKGDNNNTIDNVEVLPENIKGIYKFHLKYLGYPTIYLNYYFKR